MGKGLSLGRYCVRSTPLSAGASPQRPHDPTRCGTHHQHERYGQLRPSVPLSSAYACRGCGTLGFALAFHHSRPWRAAHRLLAPADNPWVAALRLTLHSSPALVPRSGTSVALPAAFSSPMACPLVRSWLSTAITVLAFFARKDASPSLLTPYQMDKVQMKKPFHYRRLDQSSRAAY